MNGRRADQQHIGTPWPVTPSRACVVVRTTGVSVCWFTCLAIVRFPSLPLITGRGDNSPDALWAFRGL